MTCLHQWHDATTKAGPEWVCAKCKVTYTESKKTQPIDEIQRLSELVKTQQIIIDKLEAKHFFVPDAIDHADLSEKFDYIQGWNDCRQEILNWKNK